MELAILGTRRRGRPKKTWHQQMNDDMTGVDIIPYPGYGPTGRSGEEGHGRPLGDRKKAIKMSYELQIS